MKTTCHSLNNDKGSVIVAALMILVLLTIIGFAATNMSTTELSISTNSLLYERTFYTAEAGLQHAKETLRTMLDQNPAMAQNQDWTPAIAAAVDDANDDLVGIAVVTLIQETDLNGVRYTVRIYDNIDANPDRKVDSDGEIFVRSRAWDPARGGSCSIEELVEAMIPADTGDADGYNAQEGAGSGKVYTSNDDEAIDFTDPDFAKQM